MRSLLPLVALGLTACGSSLPSVEAPGLGRDYVVMQFNFPEGSKCTVETRNGPLTQTQIPGVIRFDRSDADRPAYCILPDGSRQAVTLHNNLPNGSTGVAGLTVSPNSGRITTTVDGQLVQFQE